MSRARKPAGPGRLVDDYVCVLFLQASELSRFVHVVLRSTGLDGELTISQVVDCGLDGVALYSAVEADSAACAMSTTPASTGVYSSMRSVVVYLRSKLQLGRRPPCAVPWSLVSQ